MEKLTVEKTKYGRRYYFFTEATPIGGWWRRNLKRSKILKSQFWILNLSHNNTVYEIKRLDLNINKGRKVK